MTKLDLEKAAEHLVDRAYGKIRNLFDKMSGKKFSKAAFEEIIDLYKIIDRYYIKYPDSNAINDASYYAIEIIALMDEMNDFSIVDAVSALKKKLGEKSVSEYPFVTAIDAWKEDYGYGIKDSEKISAEIKKAAKKLPVKKLKLEDALTETKKVENFKTAQNIYWTGVRQRSFDYKKGLDTLIKKDKDGYWIYHAGRGWPQSKFDYKKALSALLEKDKNGQFIFNAGEDWKNFDFEKALDRLQSMKSKYYKTALGFWPIGIKRSEEKIRELAKTAKKLPMKKLKLENTLNEADMYMGVKTIIKDPSLLAKFEGTSQYVAEPKMDGIWVSAYTDHKGKIKKFHSRTGKAKISKGFAAFLNRDINLPDSILIGELITKKDELHIFDIIKYKNRKVLGLDNEKRRKILERLRIYNNGISLTPRYKDNFVKLFNAITKKGGEGLVLKKIGKGTKYIPGGRTPDWAKVKPKITMDYVITGFTKSESKKYGGLIKAIKLGLYKEGQLKGVGKVGSMKETDRKMLTKNQKKLVGKVVEVGGNSVFPTGATRHPFFIRLRPDLKPEDANFEKFEIKEDTLNEGEKKVLFILKTGKREGYSKELFKELIAASGVAVHLQATGAIQYAIKHWPNFKYAEAREIIKENVPSEISRRVIFRVFPPGIGGSKEIIRELEKTAKKLPMKKLKLKESERAAELNYIVNKGEKEGYSDLLFKQLISEIGKAGGFSYRFLALAINSWQNFSFSKAEEIIKSSDNLTHNMMMKLLRLLPMNIKQSEIKTKLMKKGAKKLPMKKFKLKEDSLNEMAIAPIPKGGFEEWTKKRNNRTIATAGVRKMNNFDYDRALAILKKRFEKYPWDSSGEIFLMSEWPGWSAKKAFNFLINNTAFNTGDVMVFSKKIDREYLINKIKERVENKTGMPSSVGGSIKLRINMTEKVYDGLRKLLYPIKYGEEKYKELKKTAKKLPMKKLKLKEEADLVISEDLKIRYIFDKGDPLVRLSNLFSDKKQISSNQFLDFIDKNAERLEKESHYTVANIIYITGMNAARKNIEFNYDRGLDLLIKYDKDGREIIAAGSKKTNIILSGWPRFDYKKAWRELKKRNDEVLLNFADEYWPKGIEEIEAVTKKIKAGAKKLPMKKFKLKEAFKENWSIKSIEPGKFEEWAKKRTDAILVRAGRQQIDGFDYNKAIEIMAKRKSKGGWGISSAVILWPEEKINLDKAFELLVKNTNRINFFSRMYDAFKKWPTFNYKKAFDLLKDEYKSKKWPEMNRAMFELAPKGIEQSEYVSKEIAKTAKKMPEKKLKLKEDSLDEMASAPIPKGGFEEWAKMRNNKTILKAGLEGKENFDLDKAMEILKKRTLKIYEIVKVKKLKNWNSKQTFLFIVYDSPVTLFEGNIEYVMGPLNISPKEALKILDQRIEKIGWKIKAKLWFGEHSFDLREFREKLFEHFFPIEFSLKKGESFKKDAKKLPEKKFKLK